METNKVAEILPVLAPFIKPSQLRTLWHKACAGEERKFFQDKLIEMAGIVSTMPKTYEQDGKGDAAIVSLHYFAGGSANWWIVERDQEAEQHQAFGLVDLGFGPELGYISIPELLAAGAELDLHFAPQTLGEIQTARAA